MTVQDEPKRIGDEQIDKPDTSGRIVRKLPRINAPMPTPSPHEQRIKEKTRRLLRLFGIIQLMTYTRTIGDIATLYR